MGVWTDGRTDRRMNGKKWMDGGMEDNEQKEGSDGWMDGSGYQEINKSGKN